MNTVYLDNSATTRVDQKVITAMEPYFSNDFGNPSSIHSLGQIAREVVDNSRQTLANFFNCKPNQIIFTSGGSESNNLAIKGLIEYKIKEFGNREIKKDEKPHIITSQIEHHAVLDMVKKLEKEGKIEATYIKPKKNGIVKVGDAERSIKKNTLLVSIMYVNNEVGTVQPIREIGKLIKKTNQRINQSADQRIYFHTDAVQATNYFNMDVKYLHIDLLTVSAHKIYGPKGVGALFVKEDTPLIRQIDGGGQEYALRAGTENVAGIVGLAEAIKLISNIKNKMLKIGSIKKLRDRLINGLLEIPDSQINGCRINRSPNNANISFKNAEGESILMMLDQAGIAASSGSACTSGLLEPSHVLTAIGVKPEWSHGSVRFSLGKDTTEKEIDKVIEIMPKIVKKLRKMSPIK